MSHWMLEGASWGQVLIISCRTSVKVVVHVLAFKTWYYIFAVG